LPIIKILGEAIPHGYRECEESDQYLTYYDPDGYDGRGKFTTSERIDAAIQFVNAEAALHCWHQQSRVRPLREDGEANRPLTGFSIEILDSIMEQNNGNVANR
jgi:hypothetical protein